MQLANNAHQWYVPAGRKSSGTQVKTNKLGSVYFMGDVMCKWHGATND